VGRDDVYGGGLDDAFDGICGSVGGGKDHDTAHKVRQFFISRTNGSLHMRMQSSGCSRRNKGVRSFWREHVLLTHSADKDCVKVDEINPQEYIYRD